MNESSLIIAKVDVTEETSKSMRVQSSNPKCEMFHVVVAIINYLEGKLITGNDVISYSVQKIY